MKKRNLACIAIAVLLTVSGCAENTNATKTTMQSTEQSVEAQVTGTIRLADDTIPPNTTSKPNVVTTEPANIVDTALQTVVTTATTTDYITDTEAGFNTIEPDVAVTDSDITEPAPDSSSSAITTEPPVITTVETTATTTTTAETTKKVETQPLVVTDNGSAFDKSYADFAMNIFRGTCYGPALKGENVLVSPESITFALALTANGAEGATKDAMLSTIAPGLTLDDLNSNLSRVLQHVRDGNAAFDAHKEIIDNFSDDEKRWKNTKLGVRFNIANSIWLNESGVIPKETYTSKMMDIFKSEIHYEPFTMNTYADINAWVDTQTYKMIPELLDSRVIDPVDTLIVLVNAMAFEGNWMNAEDNWLEPNQMFYSGKGTAETCDLVCSYEHGLYFTDEVKGFIKPYAVEYDDNEEYQYGLLALQLNDGVDMSSFIASLDGKKFREIWNSGEQCEYANAHWQAVDGTIYTAPAKASDIVIKTKIPKFSYDFTADELTDYLKANGMAIAFGLWEDPADFSAMYTAKNDDKQPRISEIIHKTHIELDENGTKAAAATAVIMDVSGAVAEEPEDKLLPMEITLDKPFVYAIVDMTNGMPAFIGVCNSVIS